MWFQNRRAKWKKQRKSNSMLHSPSPLMPSHALPPLVPSFGHTWGAAAAAAAGGGPASAAAAAYSGPKRTAC